MSDITGKPHEVDSQSGIDFSEDTADIPHTGKFPEGHPFREEPPKKDDGTDKFSSTPLERASTDHIQLPQDTSTLPMGESTTTTERAWYNKTSVKIVGVATLALAALGIGIKLGGGNDGEVTATPAAESPATIDTENSDSSLGTTLSESPEATIDGEELTGNIILSTAPLGENHIVAERPNGEMIKVARLGGDNPNQVASSALYLFACYLTTGSEECKTAFSTNSDVQDTLSRLRELEIDPVLQIPSNKDMQVAIFDDPEDPVTFSSRADNFGRDIYELAKGTLYFGRYIDPTGTNEWQGPETRATGVLESKVQSMSFYVEPAEDGGLTVVRFEYDIKSM